MMLRLATSSLRGGTGGLRAVSLQTARSLFSTVVEASRVVELSSNEDFLERVTATKGNGRLAVVDFTAKWCPPCKVIAPIYNQFSKEYKDVDFFKVDIDEPAVSSVVAQFEITGVPTFSFIKGGEHLGSFSGADKDQLKAMLEELR